MSRIERIVIATAALAAANLPAQVTWRMAGEPLPARSGSYAFFDQQRGRVTVCSGDTSPSGYGSSCYQLAEGGWVRVSATFPPRSCGGASEEPQSQCLLFGGHDTGSGALVAQTLRWNRDLTAFDVLSPAVSPPPRWITAMAYDTARQRVVLFGGATSTYLGDTWEWDGTTWQQRLPGGPRPAARANHAMAYDAARGRVILYGGHNGASLGDTWTWDGTNWTDVSPPPGPDRRHNLMLAYDENRYVVVMFGGKNDAGVVNNTLFEWNGANWMAGAAPAVRPVARELASLVYDKLRRKLTLVGGAGQGGTLLQDTWAFDGQTWTQFEPDGGGTLVQPGARAFAAMGHSEQRNKTVLFGGGYYEGRRWTPLNDTWESAGRLWQRRTPAVSPPPSFGGAGAILRGTGAFCFVPGRDSRGNPFNQQWVWGDSDWSAVTLNATALTPAHQVLGSLQSSQLGWVLMRLVTTGSGLSLASSLQLIVPNTGVVQPMFPTGGPIARTGSVMVQSDSPSTFSDRVWLFGGATPLINGTTWHNDVWELADTHVGGNLTWTRISPGSGPGPLGRQDACVSFQPALPGRPDPCLLVTGGSGANGTLGDHWSFDLVTRTWTLLGSGLSRSGAVMASDPTTQSSHLMGGVNDWTVYGDLWEFDGINWNRDTPPSKPSARRRHAMVYDRANHRALLLDGDVGSMLACADMWSYDGAAWQPLVGQGPVPAPRFAAAACYDEARAAMVVFGGNDGNIQPLGDTHAFASDGRWSRRANGPAQRCYAAMVYIASERRCLLFGGNNPAILGDSWFYETSADQWQPLAAVSPPARWGHAMVYDRLRDRVVLFGGFGFTGHLDDTWEYAAATGWVARAPAHRPTARMLHQMTFDESRARTVVFGGDAPSGVREDLWEWDGTDWQQRNYETLVGARTAARLVYDPDRQRMLMFSGEVSANSMTADLYELSARIDRAGAGNIAAPEGLRYYSQPALGQPLLLGFANPQGMGFYNAAPGPVQQPALQFGAPPLCEPGNMFITPMAGMVYGTVEPNIQWPVPNLPSLLGQTYVFQAFAYQAASCWRATDALHVRF